MMVCGISNGNEREMEMFQVCLEPVIDRLQYMLSNKHLTDTIFNFENKKL